MNNKDQQRSFQIEGIEDWMRQFLEDPYTSFIDAYQFRVDLFETQSEYIIEAELPDYQVNQILVEINKDTVIIQVKETVDEQQINDNTIAERMVTLPFQLGTKKISAVFRNGILEIYIKKQDKRRKKQKFIKIKVL